ncbi:MAG: hypothetical protein WC869_06380 [Phycisphaerae bacterium]|jgi:hypothetical protein
MFGRFLCVCAVFLVAAGIARAEPQTLKLRDGAQITGEVTKTETGYHVVMKYGEADYPAADVLEVVTEVSPLQEYQQRAARIDPNSAEEHFSLGEWAMNANLPEQARDEFAAAVRIQPGMEKASLRLRQMDLKLGRREQRRATTAAAPLAASRPAVAAPEEPREEWLLSDDDINRIRVEELEPNDRVRVEFSNDVINRYIEAMRSLPEFREVNAERMFRAKTPVARAIDMLNRTDSNNTALRDDIRILSDPQFMIDFRRRVWPVVGARCAAAECHGGDQPVGGMKLFRTTGNDERTNYTNFIILDGMTSRDGRYRVIDRQNPDKSLLLQYGLLPELAEARHPEKLRQPIFLNRNATSYRHVLNWIQTSLRGPKHPNYRLEYSPPLGMKLDFFSASVLDSKAAPAGGTRTPSGRR